MNSPNLFPQDESGCDELDRLIRRALKALNQQVPPARVWKRIRAELDKDKSPPRRLQTTWLSLMLQPALTILVVVLGAIALGKLSDPSDIQIKPSPDSPTPLATVYAEEELTALALAMLQDKDELRLVKTLSKPSPAGSPSGAPAQAVARLATGAGELGAIEPVRAGMHLTDAGPADQPPLIVPRDPIPNVLSPEGRALMAELSLRHRAVEDQQRKHSGPYEWHR